MKKVAIQGTEASFHDIAARKFFGKDIAIDNTDTFKDVFEKLEQNHVDNAIVALENSLYGSINEVYDLLLKYRFWVCGEVYLRIEHCLIGLKQATIKDITEVHSHRVALAQCEEYLDTSLAAALRFEHHDTAASVADLKIWNDPHKAAIASKQASELYGMNILARNIETNKENYTRFVVLQQTKQKISKTHNKTSLILQTNNNPGALYNALGAFAKQNINLSKLQSRPIVGNAWKYMFYIDIDHGIIQAKTKEALAELKQQGCNIVILGSYAKGK